MKDGQTKARSDSLYARCTPEQREELLVFLVELGGPYSKALEMLEKWGVRASLGSLSNFVSQHSLDWRLKRAAVLAAEADGKLPDGWEKSRKLAMAQKEFELAFRDLTLPEFVALERLELDKKSAKTKAKLEDRKLTIAERRIKLLENNQAKASAELKKLRDPETANSDAEREAILDEVDRIMGLKK